MQEIFKGMENGASAIQANFDELSNPSASRSFNALTVNTIDAVGRQRSYSTRIGSDYGFTFDIIRIGNLVQMNVNGKINKELSAWNGVGSIVPAGFRPILISTFKMNVDTNSSTFQVNLDGGIINRENNLSGIPGDIAGTAIWLTNDSLDFSGNSDDIVGKLNSYQYKAFTFDEFLFPDVLNNVLIGSNDGINWDVIKNYPNLRYRDPSILKVDNYFYILYTGGLLKTIDWNHFEDLGGPLEVANQWVWAPEFVQLPDGTVKIIYAQTEKAQDESSFQLKMADFNEKTGAVTNTNQPVNVNYVVGSPIDPNVTYINGSYYLWVRENDRKLYMYKSDSITGTFVNVPTNVPEIQSGWKSEAPEIITMGDKVMLYSDPWKEGIEVEPRTMQYMIADKSDLTHWSSMNKLSGLCFGPRHFGIF